MRSSVNVIEAPSLKNEVRKTTLAKKYSRQGNIIVPMLEICKGKELLSMFQKQQLKHEPILIFGFNNYFQRKSIINMKKTIIIPVLFILILKISLTYGQSCKELISYRNNELPVLYENAFNTYRQEYMVKKLSILDLEKMKLELLDESKWVASDWALLSAMILSNFKTTADLTADLLKFAPGAGLAGSGISNADKIYNIIKVGKLRTEQAKALYAQDASELIIKELSASANPLIKAANAAYNLGKNIKALTEIPEDHQNYKTQVKESIENIEREISKLQLAINNTPNKLKEINDYKEGIDRYLKVNCSKVHFRGYIDRSGKETFGNPAQCIWKIRAENIDVHLVYDKNTNKFTAGQISFRMYADRQSCAPEANEQNNFVGESRFTSLQSQKIDGGERVLKFQPVGNIIVVCKGNVNGDVFNGRIGWTQTVPSKEFTLKIKINLEGSLD